MKNPFKALNKFDICLWVAAFTAIILTFFLIGSNDYMTLVSSITGITMLMFIVKGNVVGQFLTVIFSVCYGIVAYFTKYYGEMITYLGMSTPAAIYAIVTWLRHPYKDSSSISIAKLNAKKVSIVGVISAVVTVAFYFILRALGTTNLAVSTVSVALSMIAACFTILRSPFYGLAYACNDIVRIALWAMVAANNISCLPIIVCFSLFFIYDTYGFINWMRMRKKQTADETQTPKKADPESTPQQTENI
ncbi:MAG: nicotinamide riboside transporter PnuC [Clostridiales bacterium]|nr:nicotinamide riboside transporter PnuC [Clostridiales bacterium]